jgi:hypothetical protein
MLGDPLRRGGRIKGEGRFLAHGTGVTRNSRALQIAVGYATRPA